MSMGNIYGAYTRDMGLHTKVKKGTFGRSCNQAWLVKISLGCAVWRSK